MVNALCVHTVGGRLHPQLEEVALPHPGCNEFEVRHTAIGFNYPDVEDCTGGGHHGRHAIFTPGSSAVGVITELDERLVARVVRTVAESSCGIAKLPCKELQWFEAEVCSLRALASGELSYSC